MQMSRTTETALIALGAVALGAVAVHVLSTPSAPAPSPSPAPSPGGLLPPAPNPVANDPTQLLAQLQMLAIQASTNPNAVDPAALDTLATQLQAAGLPTQAAQAAQLAAQLRAQRAAGGGVLPVGVTNPNVRPPVFIPNLPGDLLPGGQPGIPGVPPPAATPQGALQGGVIATAPVPSAQAAQLLQTTNGQKIPAAQQAQILAALAPNTTFTSEQVHQLVAFMTSSFPGQTQLLGLLQQQQMRLASLGK